MKNIILISTIHKETGMCNADELFKILEDISPEVIFLEALDDTYSEYDKFLFTQFGVFSRKLEIKAIQKYNSIASFIYVPVLNSGLSDDFEKKLNIVCNDFKLKELINQNNIWVMNYGFKFLNSAENIKQHDEMRTLGTLILNNCEIEKAVKESIDAYENTMIQKIYSYCENNQFNKAVFMFGSAHRKSIIEKIERYQITSEVNINWTYFE